MFDINMAALIVLLNEPQTQMQALGSRPLTRGRWRPAIALVVAAAGIGLVALL